MATQVSSDGKPGRVDKSPHKPTVTHDTNGLTTPVSPPYPPYGSAYMDSNQLSYDRQPPPPHHHHPNAPAGFDLSDPSTYTYVYPLSPQFSIQYYPDFSAGYQSYPGSPAIHPQSPPVNPTSPPFSPTFQYQQGGITLSPPTHAYVLPHPAGHNFPPLHISSPILSGTTSIPGSPPHQYIQPLPGSFHDRSGSYPPFHDPPTQYHPQNIYVRGLSSTTTDESFLELCQVYGKIISSKAIIDQKTGECKGYGFAMYEREEDCHHAIDGLNKTGLQASFAKVGQESFSSRLRSLQDETSTNIYISNLPLNMSEQMLEELFQPFQTVSNRILRDPQSGLSRGVGFARMADRQSALAIIERFNGHTVVGSSAPLQVRFADSAAQKKLKNLTARKRMVRPRDFQPMASFSAMPMMPITPETMLGIAPSPMPAVYQTLPSQPLPGVSYAQTPASMAKAADLPESSTTGTMDDLTNELQQMHVSSSAGNDVDTTSSK
ncbi:uncharacterized protein BYT42DRAFT_552983 [Radiomyces spectabilis]|uniref:uncharacterized protein n=1 Tax=Radiomyces spectabilis TaxID=64574 RepID=UPI00221FB471|nr:uncharacterized protein BYT42DRAFT_552983 [Radiomyces spectabilis]KAI8393992.1 hypothetical protein BYT42DRAFT_552983 [Radiomyces spectabilis]